MQYKAYIVNFNLEGLDINKIHQTLTAMPGLINWFHYIESSYILIVNWNINASNIVATFKQVDANNYLLVCRINLKECNGWLPQNAWNWLSSYSQQTF